MGASGGQTQPRRSVGDEALDDAVLERVVADDNEAPAHAQDLDRGLEGQRERLELAIDRDAECLEDARGGMDAPPPARRDGGGGGDHVGQLHAGFDRLAGGDGRLLRGRSGERWALRRSA